jgi:hypothetical protein
VLEAQMIEEACTAAEVFKMQEEAGLEVQWKLEEEVDRLETMTEQTQNVLTRVACQNAEGDSIYDTVEDTDGKGEFAALDRIKVFWVIDGGTVLRTENATYEGTGVVEAYQFAYALDMSVPTKVHVKWSGPKRVLIERPDKPPDGETPAAGNPLLSRSM